MTIKGYKRADGRVGIRNHVEIIYTVECAHHVAQTVAQQIPGAQVFGFTGCYEDAYAFRMLVELGKHPNVAGVVVIGLGCESTNVEELVHQIRQSGNRVEMINIQMTGGTLASIELGKQYAQEMVKEAEQEQTVALQASDLIIGVECGGSDATSGIAANPATGWAVDRFIEQGGRAIFSELPELLGCNDYLLERTRDDEVRQRLLDGLQRAQDMGNKLNIFAVSEGNEQGGLTTIEEKSLGALTKAGTKPISGILKTAERPVTPGLYLLDKVGMLDTNRLTLYEENDNDGLVTLIASGAHMILFTTGRGSVVGSVVAPVIKICGNPQTCLRMGGNFDIQAGSIIQGEEQIEDVGQRILDQLFEVAVGENTRAERLGHQEYHIPYKPGRACDVV